MINGEMASGECRRLIGIGLMKLESMSCEFGCLPIVSHVTVSAMVVKACPDSRNVCACTDCRRTPRKLKHEGRLVSDACYTSSAKCWHSPIT